MGPPTRHILDVNVLRTNLVPQCALQAFRGDTRGIRDCLRLGVSLGRFGCVSCEVRRGTHCQSLKRGLDQRPVQIQLLRRTEKLGKSIHRLGIRAGVVEIKHESRLTHDFDRVLPSSGMTLNGARP